MVSAADLGTHVDPALLKDSLASGDKNVVDLLGHSTFNPTPESINADWIADSRSQNSSVSRT